ncbi:hypothetical protein V6N13_041285 [Hibiscus sabdariffa]
MFNFFYSGALMICLNRLTKGMSRLETTGPAQAANSTGIQILSERLAAELVHAFSLGHEPHSFICPGRNEESEKGFCFHQNILLNIPVLRAHLKEAETIQRQDPKPMHAKDYLECKFQPIEVQLY